MRMRKEIPASPETAQVIQPSFTYELKEHIAANHLQSIFS